MTPEQIKEGRETVQFEIEFCKMVHAQGKNIVVEIFEKRLNRVAEIATQTLDALETCQEEAARVRREALLEAINKTCWMCAGGWGLQDNGDRLYHDIKTNLPDCRATAIHRMITAEQKNEG